MAGDSVFCLIINKMKDQVNYTYIQHEKRKDMWISINEYCVCDKIYHLSNKPWYERCTKTRENMAEDLWFSKQWLVKMINKMCLLWFLEKNQKWNTKTTEKWYYKVVCDNSDSVNKVVQLGKQSSTKNNKERYIEEKEKVELSFVSKFLAIKSEQYRTIRKKLEQDKSYVSKQSACALRLIKKWYTEAQIKSVLGFTLKDPFWKDNVQSVTKLEKRNKEWDLYIDVFLDKISLQSKSKN